MSNEGKVTMTIQLFELCHHFNDTACSKAVQRLKTIFKNVHKRQPECAVDRKLLLKMSKDIHPPLPLVLFILSTK